MGGVTKVHNHGKEVERFCFHLHCIDKGKSKQRSAIFKNAGKICSTGKWTFCQKHAYKSWQKSFPNLVLKKLKAFIWIVFIKGRLNNGPLYLKTLEKFVQPANENFTTLCKKQAYESWRKLFQTLILKKLKAFAIICTISTRGRLNSAPNICPTRRWEFYTPFKKSIFVMAENFCFNLQCIYKGKTKHRCDILKNARKICSTRKWKFYNIFAKNTHIWVMVEIVPDFSIKEVESFCFHLHCIYKWKTKQRSKNLFNPQMKILQRFAKKTYISHGQNCSKF